MLRRNGNAVWRGNLVDGNGELSSGSGALASQPYSFKTRFVSEDGKLGTNPEELIGAAHAACFSMALSGQLTNAGSPPEEIRTTATVSLEKQDVGFTITRIHLSVEARVPGIDDAKFREIAEKAKAGCPVSRALKPEITLDAKLLG